MHMHPRRRFRLWYLLIPFGIAAFLGGAVTLVWALWNHLIPQVFNGPHLLWWQAAVLLVLARLLFGAFGFHRGGRWGRHRGGHCHGGNCHGGNYHGEKGDCEKHEGRTMSDWWKERGQADFEAWKKKAPEETK